MQELARLELAVQEMPSIFELKYRQSLENVLHANRQISLQHRLLKSQLAMLQCSDKKRSFGPNFIRLCVSLRKSFVFLIGCGILLLAVLLIGLERRRMGALPIYSPFKSSSLAPALAPSVRPGSLQLYANGASWVEVQDLQTREVLLFDEMQAGEQRTMPIRQGLRIRSGRPDRLTVSIAGASPIPFGDSQGLGWRTVLPPELRKAGA